MLPSIPLTLLLASLPTASARDLPPNLQSFYTTLLSQKSCTNPLRSGFYSSDSGPNTFSYCGDHLSSSGIIYIRGQGRGKLANMDVDCDGVQNGPGSEDGRCSVGASPDYQNTTAFQDVIASYNIPGVTDLNTYVHPYVVFGNEIASRDSRIDGIQLFDPRDHGVEPLSVMAVVCDGGKKLVYGVWGDTNGSENGTKAMVGEASLALATACGGKEMSGRNGIDDEDVLYLAFTGQEAVPGREGARWDAAGFEEFERSVEELGERLVSRIKVDEGAAAGMVRVSWGLMMVVLVVGYLGVSGI
ncbi:fungal chitosanase [Sordaria brevicollis]|uniref:Endo-chitosanase n=1 Tax=Sordaria brevicollis TaxID=83679 RepID=A0AAE0P9X0_SORBR|nr:fungal chitosanase [Sordaria brevicollis]